MDVKGKVVAYLSGAPAKLQSTERAYYSSGAVKDAEASKRGAVGTISFTSPDDPRFRWDVSVATSAQGNYAWLDAAGVFRTTPDERRIEINWPSPIPENDLEKLQEAEAKARLGVPREVLLRELGY